MDTEYHKSAKADQDHWLGFSKKIFFSSIGIRWSLTGFWKPGDFVSDIFRLIFLVLDYPKLKRSIKGPYLASGWIYGCFRDFKTTRKSGVSKSRIFCRNYANARESPWLNKNHVSGQLRAFAKKFNTITESITIYYHLLLSLSWKVFTKSECARCTGKHFP